MALFDTSLFSEKLGMHMPVTVILPQRTHTQIGIETHEPVNDALPVLWLLHGRSDDHTIWLRRTRIDFYAEKHGVAVIMPAAHLSYYQDTASGHAYFSYICDELPKLCQQFFRISSQREDNFIAGNSMGGYGAMRCALWRPDRYAAAYSFSGSLDIENVLRKRRFTLEQERAIFGKAEELKGSEADLFHLVSEHASQNTEMPRLYACCGIKDSLTEDNRKFADHMQTTGLDYEYLEDEGGHDWDYWEAHLDAAIGKLIGG